MDSGAVGWLIRTAERNYWRVEGYCTQADLVQDGYFCYLKIAERYRGKNKAHVMALFKTAFNNHLHDLSNARRKHIACATLDGSELDIPLNPYTGFVWEDAPALIQKLFDAVAEHPHRANWKPRRTAAGVRETTTEWLSRSMGGIELPEDFHLMVREYVIAHQ